MTEFFNDDTDSNKLVEAVGLLPNFPFLLELMLDRATMRLGIESAGVMLYDPVSNRLELQAPAFGTSDAEKIEVYSVGLEDGGNAVNVFKSGQPYFSNDAPNDDRYIRKYIDMFDAKTAMTVPLIVSGSRVGILHLNNKMNGFFTDQDLRSAISYADELAVLIEQSRSFMQMNEREKEARALYEIGLQISQGSPIETILQTILVRLDQCIGSDSVGYCLMNDNGEQYEGKMMINGQFVDIHFTDIVSPELWNQLLHDEPACIHLNESLINQEFQKLTAPYRLLYGMFVPLVATTNVSGMLFVLKKRYFNFNSGKLEAMKRFAQQASLALQNHHLMKNQDELIVELKQVNHRLVYSSQIHSKLVQLVLDGGEFDDLALGIQDLVKRKIYLFDEDFKLLSSINTPSSSFMKLLENQIKPEAPFFGTMTYENQWNLVQISASTDGSQIVGYVVMTEDKEAEIEPKINELDRVVLEQSAIVFALRKMQGKIEMEIEGRMIFNWLDNVLIGDMPEDVLLRRGKTLGYHPERFNRMLLIDMKQSMDHESLDNMFSEHQTIYHKLRYQMQNDFSNNFVTTRGNIVAILLATGSDKIKETNELSKSLFQWIRDQFPDQVQYGALMEFDGSLEDLRQSYIDGEKILSLICSIGKKGLFFGADLSGYQFFLRSHNSEYLQQFFSKILAPLLELNEPDRDLWLETLSVYLETSGEIKKTAELLHIHKNSLIYRLRRLKEMLHTDLKDSAKRFDLQLACRLYNMFKGLKKG